MKNNKLSSSFTNKLSSFLYKFKDASTVAVGHQQIRKMFYEYTFPQIAIPFFNKLDNCEQTTERQKKEHLKVYGEDILIQQYYDRMIESLTRKTNSGIGEVITVLCKSLISRINRLQDISSYFSHILNAFKGHCQIHKVLKSMVQNIDASITDKFQNQIISIVQQQYNSNRNKSQVLDCLLSIILVLEDKFKSQVSILSILSKSLKHQEWNTRKIAVDICYGLLVVKEQTNQLLNKAIKELKYDKIKHVRQAVCNYEALYKQLHGDEIIVKNTVNTNSNIMLKKSTLKKNKPKVEEQLSHSLERKKFRNQGFFENAKHNDVIRVVDEGNNDRKNTQRLVETSKRNKQIKDKNVKSPKNKLSPKANFQNKDRPRAVTIADNTGNVSPKSIVHPFKHSIVCNFQKKKEQIEQAVIHLKQSKAQYFDQSQNQLQKLNQDLSLSQIMDSKQQNYYISTIRQTIVNFENKMNSRFDCIERRLQIVQKRLNVQGEENHGVQVFKKINNDRSSQLQGLMGEAGLQSNLQQKVYSSLECGNWDDAFTLVLANNNKNLLLKLLQDDILPNDRVVEQCLLIEVRKLLMHTSTLKWLKNYLMQRKINKSKLNKLKIDILKCQQLYDKHYNLLHTMVINQINQLLDKYS